MDLVEMAALLRIGDITPDTLTQMEGEEEWQSFQYRREFEWARDMPSEAILRHEEEKSEGEFPRVPFLTKVYYFFAVFFGIASYAFWLSVGRHTGLYEGHHRDLNQWLVILWYYLIGHH